MFNHTFFFIPSNLKDKRCLVKMYNNNNKEDVFFLFKQSFLRQEKPLTMRTP